MAAEPMTRAQPSGTTVGDWCGTCEWRRGLVAIAAVVRGAVSVGMILALVSGLMAFPIAAQAPPAFDPTWDIWPTAVDPAHCRAGDRVETGLQGEVPLEDRKSGRSTEGYNCNLDLVGQYQGEGGGWVSATYKNCSYTGSTWPTNLRGPDAGVQVIDASDPRNPVLSDVLTEPAMIGGTWESLKVNQKRGLLVGTGVGLFESAGFLSVYDISQDCARPKLLNTELGSQFDMPMRIITHEGDFAPDGNTYYTSASIPGYLVAVDLTDPTDPMKVWSQVIGPTGHGLGFSPDGRTMYYSTTFGLNVLDISAVQDREPRTVVPDRVPKLDTMHFADGQFTQHSIYVTYGGKPFVFTVMESGSGGVKVFDASDPTDLKLRNAIKLAINLPENADHWAGSAARDGAFGYDSHYCGVDRRVDPTALACGWIQSGIRVFDVRDPDHVTEIAYYNPPAQVGKRWQLHNSVHALLGSIIAPPLLGTFAIARALLQHYTTSDGMINDQSRLLGADLSSDWCTSPPEFHGTQLWVTCQDNGFMILQLDPKTYPPR